MPTSNRPNPDRRQEQDLAEVVRAAVKEAIESVDASRCLTPEEQEWVRKAIEAEARKARFRDAVIEKTLAGLVWGALVGIAAAVWHYVKVQVNS